MSASPLLCEVWVRSQGDALLEGAGRKLCENAGASGKEDSALYFRFAGLLAGRSLGTAGNSLRVDVATLGRQLLVPEALSGPFSPQTRLELERMEVPLYVVTGTVLTQQDHDRVQRLEGQDRHGRALSLTGLFSLAAELEWTSGPAPASPSQAARATRACQWTPERVGSRVVRRRCAVGATGAKRQRYANALLACSSSPVPATPETAKPRKTARSQQLDEASTVCLADLADGPYLQMVSFMDRRTLCSADATSRTLQSASCGKVGAWRDWGSHLFRGIRLWSNDSAFDDSPCDQSNLGWKQRFAEFAREVGTFRPPFSSGQIQRLDSPDECAQWRCLLDAEALAKSDEQGLFLEVEVLSNPDHVTLALVDWDAGGRSSVTFSPTTGTVFRERIVGDEPRRIRGDYVQRLYAALPGVHFEGSVGVYIQGDKLAFFRRWSSNEADDFAPSPPEWETTGFVSDLSWAHGPRLTPCLAFCKEGDYRVRATCVRPEPPIPRDQVLPMSDEAAWRSFDWE